MHVQQPKNSPVKTPGNKDQGYFFFKKKDTKANWTRWLRLDRSLQDPEGRLNQDCEKLNTGITEFRAGLGKPTQDKETTMERVATC